MNETVGGIPTAVLFDARAVDGAATAGPLARARLRIRADAYTLFWFAWRHFQPAGRMFTAP